MEIVFRNVSVIYDEIPALQNITCHIHSGETVLLTGVTGAGKTTFLKLIYRAVQPTTGTVAVDAIELRHIRRSQLQQLRQQMGIAFQDVHLLPDWTVEENLYFVLQHRGLPRGVMERRILRVLSQLQLSHVRAKFPGELSGGERQLVSVARALVVEPRLFLADEPTAHLDLRTMDRLIRVLQQQREERTMILATHHPEMIAAFPDARIFHLEQGRLRFLSPQFEVVG